MQTLADELEPAAEAGTDAAFAELFHGHCARLVRLAALLGADDPEDVTQEAFARLYRIWHRLGDGDPAPYLRRIVVNLVRSRRRHLRVAWRRTPPEPSPLGSAEESVLLREEHRAVLAALDRLPARQREAVVLRYWLELSETEMAAAMGVAAGTVKSHLSRGVAAVGAIVGEQR